MSDLELATLRLPYQKIANHLKSRGITITFVAKQIDIDHRHLAHCLSGIYNLTEKNRQKINELLGTNY